MDVEALLRPHIEAEGLELYDVTQGREGGRTVLRVVIDGPAGVDIDTLALLTERVSRHLDAEGYGTGPYDLQVSSPGIERALKRPEHFRREVGKVVAIRLAGVPRAEPGTSSAAERRIQGELVAADDTGATVRLADGDRTVAYSQIDRARTVFEWGPQPKPGHGPKKAPPTPAAAPAEEPSEGGMRR